MGRHVGKKLALFLAVAISYFCMFSWQLLAFKKFQFDWASTAGIVMAVGYSIGGRFIKWVNTPEYQIGKLVKPFIIALIIYIPLLMFVILPGLKLPCGVWFADSFISFYATYFYLNGASTTAITKTTERLDKKNKDVETPKNPG